jgi:cytochrome c oxidase cbb3-type subunit 3
MKQTLFLLSAFSLLLIFENCKTLSNKAPVATYKLENSLVDYGEEVYNREGCQGCHTLQLDEASASLISLDGLGGKYNNIWLYDFLDEPNQLIPGSVMPRYTHLNGRSVDKLLLQRITTDEAPDQEVHPDSLWATYIDQAELIANDIRARGRRVKAYTETIPLIAYLQQIPASPSKLRADSILNAEIRKGREAWANISLDSNSLILKTANDPENAYIGRIHYMYFCTPCHGQKGGGLIGPNLTDDYWLHGGQSADIARTIINGVPPRGMISWKYQLSPKEVGELVAYINSIRGSNPPNAKVPQGIKE